MLENEEYYKRKCEFKRLWSFSFFTLSWRSSKTFSCELIISRQENGRSPDNEKKFRRTITCHHKEKREKERLIEQKRKNNMLDLSFSFFFSMMTDNLLKEGCLTGWTKEKKRKIRSAIRASARFSFFSLCPCNLPFPLD